MVSLSKIKDRIAYRWIVIAAFFITGVILWGCRFSFGVFLLSIEHEFHLTRASTSSIYSMYMILGAIFTIMGGWALDRFGPRIVLLLMCISTTLSLILTSRVDSLWQLYITYSFLLAMGTSAMYLVVTSTVMRWFDKNRGLALGIATSSSGLGTLIMAPFATYIIGFFDWRMAFLIVGIVAGTIAVPVATLLKRAPQNHGLSGPQGHAHVSAGQNQRAGVDLTVCQASRTRSFWFFMSVFLLSAFVQILVYTHIVPHVTGIGFSAVEAAAILSLIGFGDIMGRIMGGFISDRIGRKLTIVICSFVQLVTMVWLMWSGVLWMFSLFGLVYGFANGSRGSLIGMLVGETFGLTRMGSIMGVIEIGFSIGSAIGPILGGLIFDITHSYFIAFGVAAAALFVMTALTLGIRREYAPSPTSIQVEMAK